MTGFKVRDTCCGRREITDGKFCCKNCPVVFAEIQNKQESLIENITILPENNGYGDIIYPRTKFVSSPTDEIAGDLVNADPYAQAREAQEGLY